MGIIEWLQSDVDYSPAQQSIINENNSAEPYDGSNMWAGFGIASGVGDMFEFQNKKEQYDLQADSLLDKADRYRYQADRTALMAKGSRVQTTLNMSNLNEEFNNTQEQQILKFMMQGRTGAGVQNIVDTDIDNLNWDLEMMELNGDMEYRNLKLDENGYRIDQARSKQQAAQTKLQPYKEAPMAVAKTAGSFGMLM